MCASKEGPHRRLHDVRRINPPPQLPADPPFGNRLQLLSVSAIEPSDDLGIPPAQSLDDRVPIQFFFVHGYAAFLE